MFISIYKAIAVKERELERLSSISNYSAHLMSFHSLPQPHSISQVIQWKLLQGISGWF